MTPEEIAAVREVLDRMAQAFQRRCWWADLDDLRQAAWAEVLHSWPRRDPDLPLRGWARTIARRVMRNTLWRASTPCSCPQRPEGEEVEIIRAQRRAVPPQAGEEQLADGPDYPLPGDRPRQDDLTISHLHILRLRRELTRAIMAEESSGHLALEVLLYDAPPAEIAAREGLDVTRVYRAVAAAKTRITLDTTLRTLWRAEYTDTD